MVAEILHKIGFDWHLAFFHTLNFLIVFLVLVKFAFPALKKTVSERRTKIETGLKNFSASRELLQQSKKEAAEAVASGELERKSILAKAEESRKATVKNAEDEAAAIVAASRVAGEKIKADSYMKGAEELEGNIASILGSLAQRAFDGKVSPEVNNDFVKKVFTESYGK